MKYRLYRKSILFISIVVQVVTSKSIAQDLTKNVNPFIDTHKSRWFFFASAARPFGMVSLSPDTWVKGDWKAGYLYDTLSVRCFSHVHEWQLSGIPVMPTVGKFKGNTMS